MAISVAFLIDFMLFKMGTENHVLDLLTGLDKKEFRPILLVFRCSHEMRAKAEAMGVPVLELGIDKVYGIKEFHVLFQLKKYLKKENVKIMHTFHINPDIYGAFLAKISGIPILISSRRDMGYLMKQSHKIAYRVFDPWVDAVICVSEAVKKAFCRAPMNTKSKFHVIYNGIERTRFDKAIDRNEQRRRLGFGHGEPLIGVLSNFGMVKGHTYLLDAVPKIRKVHPEAHFILAGDGNCKEKMIQRSKAMALDGSVHFVGHREDVAELLSAFDVIVLPSLSEGFSNTLVEALYMKKAVVATDVGGNPEIIRNGTTGILIKPADADAIAAAVIDLLKDNNKARDMGTQGRALVEEKFMLDNVVRRTEDLYVQLLKSKEVV